MPTMGRSHPGIRRGRMVVRGAAVAWVLGVVAAAPMPAIAQRDSCYAPAYGAGSPITFGWGSAGGGDLSGGSYLAICQARANPPPGDPTGGPLVHDSPGAIDSIVITDRISFGLPAPGQTAGPITGTITSGGGTYQSLGIIAMDGSLGRSDITLQVNGVLSLAQGFSASGFRDLAGASNLRIEGGGTIVAPTIGLADVDVRGGIAVSSERPTSGFLVSSPDVRIDRAVTAYDTFVAFGAGSTGALNIQSNATLAVNGGAGLVFVGFGGQGTLDVARDGNLSAAGLFAGLQAGSTGSITVLPGAQVVVDGIAGGPGPDTRIEIGRAGTGSLVVGSDGQAGGRVITTGELQIGSQAGGQGTVRVAQGATLAVGGFLRIGGLDQGLGAGGNGRLEIDGGQVTLGGRALIGASEGGQGAVAITSGSLTVNERLVVGHAGTGTLTISDGGRVTIVNPLDEEGLRIGRHASGNGTVELIGPTSKLEGVGNLVSVGLEGTGTLRVLDGAKFDVGPSSNGQLILGDAATARGALEVAGNGSEVRAGSLLIGNAGTGEAIVSNGGRLAVTGAVTIADTPGSIGTLRITGNGSTLDAGGGVLIGRAGQATLEVADGARLEFRAANGASGMVVGSTAAAGATVQAYDGGSVKVDGPLLIAQAADSRGTVGIGTGGRIEVGGTGAMLSIGAGERAIGTMLVGGNGGTAQFTLDGDRAVIGGLGKGSLTVAAGGTVDLRSGLLGYAPTTLGLSAGSTGTVVVEGQGALLRTGTLTIGQAGEGSVTVSNGGRLEVRASPVALGDIVMGGARSTASTLVIENGSVSAANLTTGADGAFISMSRMLGGGSLQIEGRIDLRGQLEIGLGARVQATTLNIGGLWGGDRASYVSVGTGNLQVTDAITVSAAGILEVMASGTAQAASLTVASGGIVNVSATLEAHTVAVEAGGRMLISGQQGALLDRDNDGHNTVRVDGSVAILGNGSGLHADSVNVGASGSLTASDAGLVHVVDLTTARGSDTSLTNNARLEVLGNAMLGGSADMRSGAVADIAGRLTVDGATLKVSDATTALLAPTLDIAGGRVDLSGGAIARIGSQVINNGVLDVTGGGFVYIGNVSDAPPLDGSIVVGGGGVLSGSGVNNGARFVVQADGTLRPGNSPGTMTLFGDLLIESGGILDIEFAGLGDGLHDVLNVTGSIVLEDGARLALHFLGGFAPDVGALLDFLHFGGSLTGDFDSITVSGLQAGWTYDFFSDRPGVFGLVSRTQGVADASAVPLPPTAWLLAFGAIALMGRRRRFR